MFEITESVAMQNAERAAETIRAFHAHGFELAIDDFGTGYSSLAYLQRFKVRQIKVDRYFTQELDEHETEGKALLSAIVTLSHALQMEVVAEGVETGSQLDTLTSVGCDEVQGFLLSRPLSVAAFRQHLRERHGAAHAAGATDVTDVGRMQGGRPPPRRHRSRPEPRHAEAAGSGPLGDLQPACHRRPRHEGGQHARDVGEVGEAHQLARFVEAHPLRTHGKVAISAMV